MIGFHIRRKVITGVSWGLVPGLRLLNIALDHLWERNEREVTRFADNAQLFRIIKMRKTVRNCRKISKCKMKCKVEKNWCTWENIIISYIKSQALSWPLLPGLRIWGYGRQFTKSVSLMSHNGQEQWAKKSELDRRTLCHGTAKVPPHLKYLQ